VVAVASFPRPDNLPYVRSRSSNAGDPPHQQQEHTMAKGNPNWPSTTGKPSGGGRGNGGKGK